MNTKGLLETVGSQAGQKAALEALLTTVQTLEERVAELQKRVSSLEMEAIEPECEPAKRAVGRPRKAGQ